MLTSNRGLAFVVLTKNVILLKLKAMSGEYKLGEIFGGSTQDALRALEAEGEKAQKSIETRVVEALKAIDAEVDQLGEIAKEKACWQAIKAAAESALHNFGKAQTVSPLPEAFQGFTRGGSPRRLQDILKSHGLILELNGLGDFLTLTAASR